MLLTKLSWNFFPPAPLRRDFKFPTVFGFCLSKKNDILFLALYWVFPTLAAFAGWNRGLVLLCLGVVTLWVLINLQNRVLRRKAVVAALLVLLGLPGALSAGEIQVEVKEFYGIGLTHAQNLTVINSDGSCTHFAVFELPAFQAEEFQMKLPPKARLISVSVNGSEISSPVVEDHVWRVCCCCLAFSKWIDCKALQFNGLIGLQLGAIPATKKAPFEP